MAPIKRKAARLEDSKVETSKHKADRSEVPNSKRRRKSNEGEDTGKAFRAPQPSTLRALKDEEPAFPRGGGSLLTPLEHKQIQIEATRDALFEEKGLKPRRDAPDGEDDAVEQEEKPRSGKSAKDKKNKKKQLKRGLGEDHAGEREAGVKIESLSYKRLLPGSIVLGQVSQINDHDVALSLPNNLTGYIPITSISSTITKMVEALANSDEEDEAEETEGENGVNLQTLFSIGQYLRAYVVATKSESTSNGHIKSKKHIELSVDPRQVNSGLSNADLIVNSMVQASVLSVEDHGLVMDLGLGDSSVKGFMSSKELGQDIELGQVKEGAAFFCLVTGVSSNGNIIKLSADCHKSGNIKKSNYLSEAPTVDAFLPGTAVEILIEEVTDTGLSGKIMGLVDVTADLIHSGAAVSRAALDKRYKKGEKIKARIICTFPDVEPKKLGVSLLPHILTLTSQPGNLAKADQRSPLEILPMSSIVNEAEIVKVEPGIGLFVDVGVKSVTGFVHISRIKDGKIESISGVDGPYKVGSKHRARVVGYNLMDGLFFLSMEEKILSQPFLRIEDVLVGQIVKGKIERLIVNASGVSGLLVNIAEGITGLVPETHMADVKLQHPERKFKEGMVVSTRVLSTDPSNKQIRLTLKKTLLNPEDDPWDSYSKISVGARSPGTLVKVQSTGAVVQFYGPVRAFLPVSEMSEAFIHDPRQHFQVGQVVNVHVVSVDAEAEKMTVSCKDPSVPGDSKAKALQELQIGTLVEGSVIEKSNDDVIVELGSSGLKAILLVGQLTDGSEQKNLSAMKKIRVGQTLKDLLVLEKMESKRLVILSNKSSLVNAVKKGKLLITFDDVKEGSSVAGFVKNITPNGVFVRFAASLTGLVLKRDLPEDAQKLPDFGMRLSQSVSCRVSSVDHGQGRFLLTMKDPSEPATDSKTISQIPKGDNQTVSNPIDGLSNSIDDFTLGKITKARIVSRKDTQLNVFLADNVQGRIDISEIFDDWEAIKDRKRPLLHFTTKQILDVRILGIHDARSHRFLPITHRTGKVPVFELSAKPSCLNSPSLEMLTLDQVKEGSKWIAFINNISSDCLWVNISPTVRGRIKLMDVSDDVSSLQDIEKNFPIGSALRVRVIGVDPANNRLDLSARATQPSESLTIDNLEKGMIIPGRVTKVTERSIMVQISDSIFAPVNLIDLEDDYSRANPTLHNKNDIVRVCITDVDSSNKRVILSMRPSKVLNFSLPVKDPEISSISQLKVNDILRGFVKNVADNGVFVSLGSNVTGYVRVSDLSDSFIKDWKSEFQIDQLVTAKVISVDPLLNHVQLSLKKSVVSKDYTPPLTFNDMKVGQVVTGKIRKVEDFGVFVVVDGSANVSGLCHQSEMADKRVVDVKKLYNEGDAVKAKILKVNPEKRRISFGLKASYFSNPSDDEDDSMEEDSDVMEGVQIEASNDGAFDAEDLEMDDDGVDLDQVKDFSEQDINGSEEAGEDEYMEYGNSKRGVAGLTTTGFDWNVDNVFQKDKDAESDAGDDESNTEKKKKKRKRSEIKIDRTGDLDAHGPQSVSDFERLLLGQPDSSFLWLSYMAFQLQLGEVAKARDLAERALKTINIREQEEKLNVWVAMLNLENTYGSDELVEEVFKRACQYNDAQEMHERLASIYIQSGKHKRADELFQTTVKKFSQSPQVWLNYATFLMTTLNEPARSRALLSRATQALPSHTHLDITSKFAQLEFRSPNGDPERGRTMFEGLLSTFSKRWDIWSVLLDLEMKQGDKAQVRRLFERITTQKLKARKARWFFKRWMEYEEKEGDAKSVGNVKARAEEYVRLHQGQNEE